MIYFENNFQINDIVTIHILLPHSDLELPMRGKSLPFTYRKRRVRKQVVSSGFNGHSANSHGITGDE